MQKVYYPITQYHILLSVITMNSGDAIVLDEKLFDSSLIQRISEFNEWGNVFILRNIRGTKGFLERFILRKGEYGTLFSMSEKKIVCFSYGDRFCIFALNLLSKKNNIVMMEDGIPPYNMKNIATEWKAITEELKKDYLYEIIWKIFKIKTDSSFIDSIEVFKSILLTSELQKKWHCKQIEESNKKIEKRSDTLKQIFDFTEKANILDYDIVYFDTSYNKNKYSIDEFDTIKKLFSFFSGKKVAVKFRNKRRGGIDHERTYLFERIKKYYSGETTIDLLVTDAPWEIIYMNNIHSLRKTIFVNMNISTVMVTPKIIFEKEQKSIICEKIFLPDNSSEKSQIALDHFIDRFNNLCIYNKIHKPETLSELKTILNDLSEQTQ